MFQKKPNESIVLFNNRDSVGFIKPLQPGTAIQKEGIREVLKKKEKNNKNKKTQNNSS